VRSQIKDLEVYARGCYVKKQMKMMEEKTEGGNTSSFISSGRLDLLIVSAYTLDLCVLVAQTAATVPKSLAAVLEVHCKQTYL
jgi:hypothetical protein